MKMNSTTFVNIRVTTSSTRQRVGRQMCMYSAPASHQQPAPHPKSRFDVALFSAEGTAFDSLGCKSQVTCHKPPLRGLKNARRPTRRGGFILLLVLVVLVMATLAALNFSRSMLITHEASRISAGRLQSRMCAESGAQSIRLLVAYPRSERLAQGGTWDNPTMFQAVNVIPDVDPARRGNYSVLSPSLDEFGNYTGIRYGLQNESAKLNLNTLAQLDALAAAGTLGAAATGGAAGGGGAGGGTDPAASMTAALSSLASEATASMSSSMSTGMLMSLPGMTEEIADAILDWLDADDEPRPLGAEFADYYMNLQPAYKPANGPIESIEQLLLVRGVTPQMLFGYDENRNGMLDQAESTKMSMGLQAGQAPGALAPITDPNILPPPPLGWAPYLTLQSQEKNVASDGTPRVNVNGDDMLLLSEDLAAVLQNEEWSSFILAYRYGGAPGGDGTSPLVKLASMAAADSEQTDGAMGAQLDMLSSVQGATAPGGAAQGGNQSGTPPQPWSSSAMSSIDLSQAGSVKFNQVLDLIDATITLDGPAGQVTYSSPFTSLPLDLANSTPVLMDYLTTVDAPAIPGRINIMECPQEILRGVPGLTDEVVDQILEARVDGSDSLTRDFETWLAVEGFVTMDEMRAILPLVTCGGDVFKAQIVGYMEGEAAFSRVEAVISGVGDVPLILFFRRMDHLDRGFDIATLGQRFDVGNQMGASH